MKRKAPPENAKAGESDAGEGLGADPVGKHEEVSTKRAKLSKKKYILFVGNLSYDAKKEDLEAFFADCKTVSIRLLTDKVTKKPKGFAFVEFKDSSSLEAALGKHNQKIKGRKVNIALTVGGGGSGSAYRRNKIKEKNKQLEEERSRSAALHKD